MTVYVGDLQRKWIVEHSGVPPSYMNQSSFPSSNVGVNGDGNGHNLNSLVANKTKNLFSFESGQTYKMSTDYAVFKPQVKSTQRFEKLFLFFFYHGAQILR